MFEELIKELKRMDGQSVSVPIEADDKGYIDKQCPSEECKFIFKVNDEDWVNIFKNEAVWCPLCRHEAPADQWFTIEQIEHAQAEALAVVEGKIHNALEAGAREFNRRQPKNGFISISMEVSGGTRRTYPIPAKAAELMQLEIQCEECHSRFAVIGSAYFCPACGYNSVTQTFSDSLRKIKAKKDNIDIIRKALIESVGKDEAELICRSLRETCISDGVVAFQKYCEGLYDRFGKAPFNAFQRLDQGSNLWLNAVQKGYSDWLYGKELAELNVLYQKRHILAHNEGIVDSQYIKKSGDASYKEGQRIVVSDKDIDALLSALEKLSKGIKAEVK
jgi:RNA polymerase subunit RPABC4/transcription elongation factor Spt4